MIVHTILDHMDESFQTSVVSNIQCWSAMYTRMTAIDKLSWTKKFVDRSWLWRSLVADWVDKSGWQKLTNRLISAKK